MLTALSCVIPAPDRLDEVKRTVEAARHIFLGLPGCEIYDVEVEGGDVIVLEVWTTAEEFHMHVDSEPYRLLCATVDQYLLAPFRPVAFDPADLTIL